MKDEQKETPKEVTAEEAYDTFDKERNEFQGNYMFKIDVVALIKSFAQPLREEIVKLKEYNRQMSDELTVNREAYTARSRQVLDLQNLLKEQNQEIERLKGEKDQAYSSGFERATNKYKELGLLKQHQSSPKPVEAGEEKDNSVMPSNWMEKSVSMISMANKMFGGVKHPPVPSTSAERGRGISGLSIMDIEYKAENYCNSKNNHVDDTLHPEKLQGLYEGYIDGCVRLLQEYAYQQHQGWPGEGVRLISEERIRQVEKEGWTKEHDETHSERSLVEAAICYAMPFEKMEGWVDTRNGSDRESPWRKVYGLINPSWPWDEEWDKRKKHGRIKQLTIAGALIAAEIDRLKDWKGKGDGK
jgi:hypothetical protein